MDFNCSSNSSINATIANLPITAASIGYAIAVVLLVWIFCFYIIYLVYHIIKYIQEKPPNLQTLLDGFYVQLFVSWIIGIGMTMIFGLFIQLGSLNIRNEIITEIVSWLYYSSTLFMSISLGTSSVARMFLILWPNQVQDFDDGNVWLFNG